MKLVDDGSLLDPSIIPLRPDEPRPPATRIVIAEPLGAAAVEPPSAVPQPLLRLLSLPAHDESVWKRAIYLTVGMLIAAAFLGVILTFHAPGPGAPGIDENAYLVGGRLMARHLSPGLHPATPYAFVGPMWFRAASGWYYPKYPAGIPLLNAIAIWIGGGHNVLAACYVSPACATLAVAGTFFLARTLAGSFLALLATLAMATNPTMMQLALVPSSHAPAICFAVWGMVALLSWWRTGRLWVGAAAGFFIGFTFTLRYSEGLLGLPLGIAALMTVRWSHLRSYLRAAVPVLAWAVPVVVLLVFNRIASGHWTGYDSTHESTGFTVKEFQTKWEYTIQQLYSYGLFLMLPLGVLGMLLMFERSWRLALVMVLWFFPSALLYTAYYWGQNSPGVGFLRFFLTLYPPIIVSAVWLIGAACRGLLVRPDADGGLVLRRGSVALPIGAGVFAVAVTMAGAYVAIPDMERQRVQNTRLAFTGQALLDTIPAARHHSGKPDPIFFADEGGMGNSAIMYLQFVGEGDWYGANAMTVNGRTRGFGGGRPGGGGGPGRGGPDGQQADPDAPVLIDPVRTAFAEQTYAGKTSADFAKIETQVIGDALDAGRPVYAILSQTTAPDFRRRLLTEGLDCKSLGLWHEPVEPVDPTATPAAGNPVANGGGRGGGFFGGGGGGRFGGGNGGPPGGGPGGGPGGRGGRQAAGAGGLAPPGGMRFGGGTPQTLLALQVIRKPAPARPPATAPSAAAAAD